MNRDSKQTSKDIRPNERLSAETSISPSNLIVNDSIGSKAINQIILQVDKNDREKSEILKIHFNTLGKLIGQQASSSPKIMSFPESSCFSNVFS